jgi:hypothetical protein
MYIEETLLPLMSTGFGHNPATFLGGSLAELLNAVGYTLVTTDSKIELLRFLRLLQAVAVGHFRFGAGQQTFVLQFDGQQLQLTPENHSERLGVDAWAVAAHSSVLLADFAGSSFLNQLDDEVFTDSDGASSAFDLAYYRYLANFYGNGHDVNSYYKTALAAAAQRQCSIERGFFVKSIRLPELKLLHTMLNGDQADIDEALRLALVAHGAFGASQSRLWRLLAGSPYHCWRLVLGIGATVVAGRVFNRITYQPGYSMLINNHQPRGNICPIVSPMMHGQI